MSAIGSLVHEVQEIVEESAFRSEEEILMQIEERFANRPGFRKFAIEIARYEFKAIQSDLRGEFQ